MSKYNSDEVLQSIWVLIQWFDKNNSNTNISATSEKLDELNIWLARFVETCCDAFDLEAQLEDEYKTSFAKRVKELVDSGKPVSKAEHEVVVELADKKKDWTTAISVYKRLKSRLERFDKIIDGKRQRLSIIKMTELKNV
jgi:hypothetical protein